MLRRPIQTVAALFALYLLLSVGAGIHLAEAAIHVRRKAVHATIRVRVDG